MLFRNIIFFFSGFLNISIEGFFVERFINMCKTQNIILENLHIENNYYIKAKVLQSDFRELKNIAKKTKCKIKIESKKGIPFVINRYRKRKVFAIAVFVIAFFIFTSTSFIWNIDVKGNENISRDDILELVKQYGISIGKLNKNINTEKIINSIRLKRDDISWIGIEIKGTNVIISINEATNSPELIDRNEKCNIIASKDAEVVKIIVQSGTALVSVGDFVNRGDILVKGEMEGKYTGIREVHSEATIIGKTIYEKSKTELFNQSITEETGNVEEKKSLLLNNFKINFNKGVSKFENYDTISSKQKIKIFSNTYLPIEFQKIIYKEKKTYQKVYTEEELVEKIEAELENEIESEFEISKFDENSKTRRVEINNAEDGITLKLIYEILENIGEKDKIN